MFTIGGGYAMIPLIEREVVNRGWLDKQDFMDLFAMTRYLCCQYLYFCRLQTQESNG